MDNAPSIERGAGFSGALGGGLWTLQLGNAVLRFSEAQAQHPTPAGIPFEVHASAALSLDAPGFNGYQGRAHSLWFGDPDEQNRFRWYEMAFMTDIFVSLPGPVAPFALSPNEGAPAITTGVNTVQLAMNLKRVEPTELDEFIVRWGNWLADAASGSWSLPSLPYEPIVPTCRGR
jgi:serine/threonine-protein kinase